MTTWDDEWTYEECCDKCVAWGGPTTTGAFERYRLKVKDRIGDCRILFEWRDADGLSKRARCIRGAFHRIATKGRDDGECSKYFKARFRVVRG